MDLSLPNDSMTSSVTSLPQEVRGVTYSGPKPISAWNVHTTFAWAVEDSTGYYGDEEVITELKENGLTLVEA